jgi:hypothetical protein
VTDITVPTQLPLFEGHRPTGAGVRLTGKVTTPFRALGLDEEVVLVVKATVAKVSHDRDGDAGAITRLHVLKVAEAHELPGDQADMALVEGQVWSKKIADSYAGQPPLPDGDLP